MVLVIISQRFSQKSNNPTLSVNNYDWEVKIFIFAVEVFKKTSYITKTRIDTHRKTEIDEGFIC